MSNVVVVMKTGERREFPHVGRSGGSYTKVVKYEGAFVIIIDEYDKRVAIPAEDVAEVVETPYRSYY